MFSTKQMACQEFPQLYKNTIFIQKLGLRFGETKTRATRIPTPLCLDCLGHWARNVGSLRGRGVAAQGVTGWYATSYRSGVL